MINQRILTSLSYNCIISLRVEYRFYTRRIAVLCRFPPVFSLYLSVAIQRLQDWDRNLEGRDTHVCFCCSERQADNGRYMLTASSSVHASSTRPRAIMPASPAIRAHVAAVSSAAPPGSASSNSHIYDVPAEGCFLSLTLCTSHSGVITPIHRLSVLLFAFHFEFPLLHP